MKFRELGSTGMKISEIGFGTWGIGGNSYGPVDDNVAKMALEKALERGINFFDTSDIYGDGHSEELLGNVFSSRRKDVIIASKGGTLPHKGFYMPQNFSSEHLERALDKSLVRLRTDYIDLYQLHSPTIEDLEKGVSIETLEKMKKKGKIREFGVSVRSPNDGMLAIQKYNFPVIQVNYNLIDQRANEIGLFALANSKNTGVIVRTPLVFGYLTGKLNGNEEFGDQDHRANWPKDQLKHWASATDVFSFLYKKKTPIQAALRFCLDFDAVSTIIPGMKNSVQVKENVLSSELSPFTENEHIEIKEIYKTHGFDDKMEKIKASKK